MQPPGSTHVLRHLFERVDLAAVRFCLGISEVSHQIAIAQDVERFDQGVVVVRTKDHRGTATILRYLDAFMGTHSIINQLGKLGASFSKRDSRHVPYSSANALPDDPPDSHVEPELDRIPASNHLTRRRHPWR